MRVILDTNVVVASMLSSIGASHAILLGIHHRKVTPVLSVPLLFEYEEVCKRPGMIPHLKNQQIDIILNQICSRSLEQKVFFRWRPFLPDPSDDMLVELAIASGVKHIVTGNLKHFEPAKQLGI